MPLAASDKALGDAAHLEQARIYADRAIELLREAVTRGYHDVVAVKNNRAFDALKSRADFQDLLARLTASSTNHKP